MNPGQEEKLEAGSDLPGADGNLLHPDRWMDDGWMLVEEDTEHAQCSLCCSGWCPSDAF